VSRQKNLTGFYSVVPGILDNPGKGSGNVLDVGWMLNRREEPVIDRGHCHTSRGEQIDEVDPFYPGFIPTSEGTPVNIKHQREPGLALGQVKVQGMKPGVGLRT
jgi:hypothetical protein